MSFEATTWYGRCPYCDETIRPGDLIEYEQDAPLVHVSCRRRENAPVVVCEVCFTQKSVSGACMCEAMP